MFKTNNLIISRTKVIRLFKVELMENRNSIKVRENTDSDLHTLLSEFITMPKTESLKLMLQMKARRYTMI